MERLFVKTSILLGSGRPVDCKKILYETKFN